MDPDVRRLTDELEQSVPEKMRELEINGFSVAIVGKTGKLWSKGFGYADQKENPVSSTTLFMIGSLSKAYTVTAFLRAVREGLVSLDDRLIDVYPEFNWNTRFGEDERGKITFRHLLTHWAGFQHNIDLKNPGEGYIDFSKYMERIGQVWQKYPVGSRFSYSNIGFDLAAGALEKITGMSFGDWMIQQVYGPLGMTRSNTDAAKALDSPDVARGNFGNKEFSTSDMVSPQIGSGTQYSSVDDMSNFIQMHLNGGEVNGEEFLGKAQLDEVYKIPFKDENQLIAIGMGIGVRRFKYGGTLLLSFFGDGPGYLSLHQIMPELGIGWVMSCNQSVNSFQLLSGVAGKIEEFLVIARLGELPPDIQVSDMIPPREKVEVQESTLDRLSGHYVSRMSNITVENKEGSLIFNWKGEQSPLEAYSNGEFGSNKTPVVKFNLDETGRPLTATILPGDGYTTVLDYDGGPVDPSGPAKPEWVKYRGYYRYDYGVLCWYNAVNIVDGHLTLIKGRGEMRLEEHEPGLFFTSDGQDVRFTEDSLILPDGVYWRDDLSAEFLRGLVKSNPEDIRLHGSSIESIVSILQNTGNHEEAKRVQQILSKK